MRTFIALETERFDKCASNMDSSLFATLPAESRNHIYQLALRWDKPYVLMPSYSTKETMKAEINGPKHPFGLAMTCKAVSSECFPVFYAENRFTLRGTADHTPLTVLDIFRRKIGERNAQALRSITLDFGDTDCDRWAHKHRDEFTMLLLKTFEDSRASSECKIVIKNNIRSDTAADNSELKSDHGWAVRDQIEAVVGGRVLRPRGYWAKAQRNESLLRRS